MNRDKMMIEKSGNDPIWESVNIEMPFLLNKKLKAEVSDPPVGGMRKTEQAG